MARCTIMIGFFSAVVLTGFFAVPAASRFVLKVVHINDMHAHISGISEVFSSCSGDNCFGGFPRVSAVAKEILAQDPNRTLFLNGGDNFQGSAFYTYFKSEVILDFINRMGFDATALGNHEFDDGIKELHNYLQKINTDVVCANMDVTNAPFLREGTKLKNWTMVEKSGVKIGIVGYITTDTKYVSKARNVTFLNDVESVRKYAKEARSQGAQIVIALGHSGYDIDQTIARTVEEVDIVVGAHSHTFLYTGSPPDPLDKPMGPYPTRVTQASGKIVPVVQAYKYTKYLGTFEVEFDDNFKLTSVVGEPILLAPALPQDPELLPILQKWDEKLNTKIPTHDVLTYFTKDASLDDCRSRECELGNMVTDAMASIGCEGYPACIAIVNGGGIRNGIMKGNLSSLELVEVFPFYNNITVVQINGTLLMEVLERSVMWYDMTGLNLKGGFLQMAGLRVVYDLQYEPGHRVVSAEARTANPDKYSAIVDKQLYNIVMTKYVYDGGDNYTIFHDNNISDFVFNVTDYEAAAIYLAKLPSYTPSLESRIQVILPPKPNNTATRLGPLTHLPVLIGLSTAFSLAANNFLR